MRRLLIVLVTAFALFTVGGCFSRPTEPKVKAEGESNFDRMKNLQGGGKKGAKKIDISKDDAKK